MVMQWRVHCRPRILMSVFLEDVLSEDSRPYGRAAEMISAMRPQFGHSDRGRHSPIAAV